MSSCLELKSFMYGLKRGFPIFLGYLPVSFTFGFMAVSGGIPVWAAVLISLTNVTSAGQFAGTNLIFASAGYLEIALTTFVINLRYSLMSLSLSQKIQPDIPIWKRLILSFCITDETFVMASMEPGQIGAGFFGGLITLPFIGWVLGTFLGGTISTLLPAELQSAMGIGLYAMFIALIVPAAREKENVCFVVLLAVLCSCIIRYVPGLNHISSGFRVILSTIIAAGIGARLFPEPISDAGDTPPESEV